MAKIFLHETELLNKFSTCEKDSLGKMTNGCQSRIPKKKTRWLPVHDKHTTVKPFVLCSLCERKCPPTGANMDWRGVIWNKKQNEISRISKRIDGWHLNYYAHEMGRRVRCKVHRIITMGELKVGDKLQQVGGC